MKAISKIQAVATGKASTECVSGNMVALNRMAVALKYFAAECSCLRFLKHDPQA